MLEMIVIELEEPNRVGLFVNWLKEGESVSLSLRLNVRTRWLTSWKKNRRNSAEKEAKQEPKHF